MHSKELYKIEVPAVKINKTYDLTISMNFLCVLKLSLTLSIFLKACSNSISSSFLSLVISINCKSSFSLLRVWFSSSIGFRLDRFNLEGLNCSDCWQKQFGFGALTGVDSCCLLPNLKSSRLDVPPTKLFNDSFFCSSFWSIESLLFVLKAIMFAGSGSFD